MKPPTPPYCLGRMMESFLGQETQGAVGSGKDEGSAGLNSQVLSGMKLCNIPAPKCREQHDSQTLGLPGNSCSIQNEPFKEFVCFWVGDHTYSGAQKQLQTLFWGSPSAVTKMICPRNYISGHFSEHFYRVNHSWAY